jgi:hypothetical protein
MARRDLTNHEIERMAKDSPGSAAEYLRLRREELEAERQAAREQQSEEHFIEEFVSAGGERSAAKEAYRQRRNEEALWTASLAEEAAVEQARLHIARSL